MTGRDSIPGCPRVAIVTVGCPKNVADSDYLTSRIADAGFKVVDDAASAEVVIVNTCGFIAPACEESLDTTLELAELKSGGNCKYLFVAGCMAERYGDDLSAELPEVDEFFGLVEENAEAITACLVARLSQPRGPEGDTAPARSSGAAHPAIEPAPRAKPYAYVKVSDGCDRACSFCTIPSIRGPYRSRSEGEITAEVSRLVESGTAEIILVGQDTTAWGKDLEGLASEDSPSSDAFAQTLSAAGPPSLAGLLGHLAAANPDTWFRVMYLQPDGVTDELVAAVASHGNVCSYFDIPFQHASTSVLRSMRRAGDANTFLSLVRRIRAHIPNAALRTSLIAGFPGETQGDFDELAQFIRDANIDFAGIFAFSPEEGTEAASLPNQIDPEIIAERQRMLADLAEETGARRAALRVGATLDVLIQDSPAEEDILYEGRSHFQAPEVDGVCLFAKRADEGRLVRARVIETEGYDMICELP